MPKKDFAQIALSVVQKAAHHETTRPSLKTAKGRPGGLKGGNARAKSLTKEKRAEIARLAAAARWRKSK